MPPKGQAWGLSSKQNKQKFLPLWGTNSMMTLINYKLNNENYV